MKLTPEEIKKLSEGVKVTPVEENDPYGGDKDDIIGRKHPNSDE